MSSLFHFSEDLEEEAKKSSKWLDDDDEGACGFAIGRRIFEKAEIEVTEKLSLSIILETFRNLSFCID